jgi:hypothetical protein
MRTLCLSLAILAVLASSPVRAELENENLLVGVPEGFKLAFKDRNDERLMSEMIPEGETLDDWSEMLTTQVFFGGLPATPDQFYAEMRKGWLEACEGGNGKLVRSGTENGYKFAFGFLTCPLNPKTDKPEAAWIKLIQGHDSMYVVQRATTEEPTKETIEEFSKFLREVKVCDSRLPDRPCPEAPEAP